MSIDYPGWVTHGKTENIKQSLESFIHNRGIKNGSGAKILNLTDNSGKFPGSK
jgi:hypothetical protein